ncbi:queuosine precursor transporter [Novosphingobium sp. 1949]|uniref:Probable queuosine precursor transporter n=1 Tax=Novosphingobium organovorum TaxID=2930092 RepID=A0ABT0BH29_9SPHN|nr:queuosine precursor transporter [Novosphingobium organovorum]MCJ2184143.1 queuosine precursor transporter [Novosphingobium organovorum]
MAQADPHAPPSLTRLDGKTGARRHFRYFDYAMAAFVAILLLSNLIGAAKLATFQGWTFGAGILFFPVSYVLGDVLTEVYGYANARRCVWVGFFALLFMAFMSFVVVAMPSSPDWGCAASGDALFAGVLGKTNAGTICQATYVSVFGSTWRIVLASVLAFWAGEFVNSYVMAKMKVFTKGRYMWTRTIGSTVFGQAVDSAIFYPVAFFGVWTSQSVLEVLLTNWALKVLWEVVLTPVTYAVVGFLKRREGVDVFDDNLDFSPFARTEAV